MFKKNDIMIDLTLTESYDGGVGLIFAWGWRV